MIYSIKKTFLFTLLLAFLFSFNITQSMQSFEMPDRETMKRAACVVVCAACVIYGTSKVLQVVKAGIKFGFALSLLGIGVYGCMYPNDMLSKISNGIKCLTN